MSASIRFRKSWALTNESNQSIGSVGVVDVPEPTIGFVLNIPKSRHVQAFTMSLTVAESFGEAFRQCARFMLKQQLEAMKAAREVQP